MKAKKRENGKFVVSRNNGTSFFWFYVDDTGSSWTKRIYFAQEFPDKESAERAIANLKERNRQRKADCAAHPRL